MEPSAKETEGRRRGGGRGGEEEYLFPSLLLSSPWPSFRLCFFRQLRRGEGERLFARSSSSASLLRLMGEEKEEKNLVMERPGDSSLLLLPLRAGAVSESSLNAESEKKGDETGEKNRQRRLPANLLPRVRAFRALFTLVLCKLRDSQIQQKHIEGLKLRKSVSKRAKLEQRLAYQFRVRWGTAAPSFSVSNVISILSPSKRSLPPPPKSLTFEACAAAEKKHGKIELLECGRE